MEFAPPTRRAKPITKAELKKLRQNYAESAQYSEENRKREEDEKKAFEAEFDDDLNTL
jgi:hypothetical protein